MTLFSDRDERVLENLRIINSRFLRRPRRLPVRGERPVESCCPSCPAIVHAVIDGTMTTTETLNWVIDNDPDVVVSVDASGDLHLVKPGYYLIAGQFSMQWTLSVAGWTNWLVGAIVVGNDAADFTTNHMSGRSTATDMMVDVPVHMVGHVPASNARVTLLYSLTDQTATVNTATGVLINGEFTVTRHTNGCARLLGS